MKVIRDNYQKFPKEVTCEKCGSIIELEDIDDINRNCYTFAPEWECPVCGKKNEIEIL